MKRFQKMTSLLLALVLVLGLTAPGLEVHAASEGMVDIELTGLTDYAQIFQIVELVNEERAAAGLDPVTYDTTLAGYANTRAAECYVYYSHTRPDGSDVNDMLDDTFKYSGGTRGENIAIGQSDAAEVMEAWMNSPGHRANILNPDYNYIGIGMFYQENGTPTWVQLFHSDGYDPFGDYEQNDVEERTYTIEADPANLTYHVAHAQLTNAFCAFYLYEGMTMGTQLYLVNPTVPDRDFIPVNSDDYSYVSSDPSVFTVNNADRTATAVAPGKATLSVRYRNQTVPLLTDSGFVAEAVDVDVMELPSLSYTDNGNGCYAIDYSGFSAKADGLVLWIKGNHDEMWMMGNIEADRIYDFYPMDPTDTYVCVMRYYDPYREEYVEVGDRLVIQLGDEEPDIPEPTDPETTDPVPDKVYLDYPTAGELPQWNSEPSVDQIRQEIDDLMARYPSGTILPEYGYNWNAGIDGPDRALEALSDMLFGTLPGREIPDATVDDIRPGDLIYCDGSYHNMLVVDVTSDYVYGIGVSYDGSDYYLTTDVISAEYAAIRGTNVYTRYASEPTGAASIVPADAHIIARGDCSLATHDWYGNVTGYYYVIKWALAADGTFYIDGRSTSVSCTAKNSGYDGWSNYADQIRNIVIGPGITAIGDEAFKNCTALTELRIPESVTSIGDSAFAYCTALAELQIPASVTTIGDSAFYSCTALTEVAFPGSVKTIGENAFAYCDALADAQFSAGLLEIGEAAFRGAAMTSVILPEGLQKLGFGAFRQNDQLTQVYIPGGIREMDGYAFSECKALTDVQFGEGLSVLGEYVFYECDALKSITIPGSLTRVPEGAFCYCDALETVILESGVETIGQRAFDGDRGITNLHLPNTLKLLEQDAFRNMEGEYVEFYFYGTPQQWETVEIESGNWGVELWAWKFHYVDPDACRHGNVTVLPGVEPTCTEDGLTEGTVCADCGETVTAQETIPATGHDYTAIVTDPTCTEGGHTTYTCRNCGDGYVDDYTDPLGHNWSGNVCDRCGAVNENPFADVKTTDFYYEPVLWAVENGITAGTGANTFAPMNTCTRAQVVTFLWRAVGKPQPSSEHNPFTDVAQGSYYYEAVLWAVENGITAGTGANTFSPDQSCTRAQMVTFLWRAMGKEEPASQQNPFADVKTGDYFYVPVLWAVENGITAGTAANAFSPNNPCTRGQVVTFLYRAMGD